MSLDPPTYLASLQDNIRRRPIPWDGAVRAGTLTEEQLAKIRAVGKDERDVRRQVIEANLDGYKTLFAGNNGQRSVLELASKRPDVCQYLLVLLSDLLDGWFPLFPATRDARTLLCSFHLFTSFPSSPVAASTVRNHLGSDIAYRCTSINRVH